MSILEWLATLPSSILLLAVICMFFLLLLLLIAITLSDKAAERVVRVIEAFQGKQRQLDRCPRCRTRLRGRA
jgi:uncharacterized protein with PIN domain